MYGAHLVTVDQFREAIATAGEARPLIAAATTEPHDLPEDATYVLNHDGTAGFGIDGTTLIGVFSTVKGQGALIINRAISLGATDLDCFDGHLVEFYARFGFREVRREPNWTEGEPDVVWMAL